MQARWGWDAKLCKYSGESFQGFETLGLVNVDNSFGQDELIRDGIESFASIKKKISQMIYR